MDRESFENITEALERENVILQENPNTSHQYFVSEEFETFSCRNGFATPSQSHAVSQSGATTINADSPFKEVFGDSTLRTDQASTIYTDDNQDQIGMNYNVAPLKEGIIPPDDDTLIQNGKL